MFIIEKNDMLLCSGLFVICFFSKRDPISLKILEISKIDYYIN